MDKERKAIIKNSDMTEDMQQDAINVATKAIDSYNIEKDIACYIKFIYFYLGQIAVLLFKSG